MSLLMVAPTYNEAESIVPLVADIVRLPEKVEILIVDDESPDGTGEIAACLALEHPRVHVLRRPGKLGFASAYRDGFRWAIGHGFDVVGQMDADGSHSVDDIPRLMEKLEHNDVVIGSRWAPNGATANWPVLRRALSRLGNRYACTLGRLPLHDATGGFRIYRADVVADYLLSESTAEGYYFQIETALMLAKAGKRMTEVPIVFSQRLHGESKLTAANAFESLRKVTLWGLRYRTENLKSTLRERIT